MRAGRRTWGALLLVAAVAFAAFGLLRAATSDAPTQREQVDAIAATIRCPTCQGLSVKDSPSVLADGSRKIVEEQVAQGRTPDQVRQYFVDRYGSYILLSPDPAGPGLVVWLLPVVGLPLAGVLALRWLRRRREAVEAVPQDATGETDGDALTALAGWRAGRLVPDGSPAGEALREALLVRAALDEDGDTAALPQADLRVAAAYRRYTARRLSQGARRSGGAARRPVPRRALTVASVAVLVVGAGAALATGVRTRGANDLPTGDLPGSFAAPAGSGLDALLAAVEDKPQDQGAWIALGRAYEGAAQFTPALAAYERALSLDPTADDVVLLRAGVLVKAGSPTEALPVLTGLAARRPADPDVLLLLGLAQDRTGAPAADATLRRFLSVAPDSPAVPLVRSLLETP